MALLIFSAVDWLFKLATWALLARVLLSWIPHNANHPAIQFLFQVTDPILRPFQNIMPPTSIGIDISPIFAFIALGLARQVTLYLLQQLFTLLF